MSWRVIIMVVAGMLAVGAAPPAREAGRGALVLAARPGAALAYDWGPIGLDAATITHRRATLTVED